MLFRRLEYTIANSRPINPGTGTNDGNLSTSLFLLCEFGFLKLEFTPPYYGIVSPPRGTAFPQNLKKYLTSAGIK
jgi:hypothetical protein